MPLFHSQQSVPLFQQACSKHQAGGDQKRHRALLQQAVQADPNLEPGETSEHCYVKKEKFEESRHCTEQALQLDCSDGSLWGNYGNVLGIRVYWKNPARPFAKGCNVLQDLKGCCRDYPSALDVWVNIGRLSN